MNIASKLMRLRVACLLLPAISLGLACGGRPVVDDFGVHPDFNWITVPERRSTDTERLLLRMAAQQLEAPFDGPTVRVGVSPWKAFEDPEKKVPDSKTHWLLQALKRAVEYQPGFDHKLIHSMLESSCRPISLGATAEGRDPRTLGLSRVGFDRRREKALVFYQLTGKRRHSDEIGLLFFVFDLKMDQWRVLRRKSLESDNAKGTLGRPAFEPGLPAGTRAQARASSLEIDI